MTNYEKLYGAYYAHMHCEKSPLGLPSSITLEEEKKVNNTLSTLYLYCMYILAILAAQCWLTIG